MKRTIFFLSILLLVSGCGGTYQAYLQTLQLAFEEKNDIELSLAEVKESKVDLISVKRGERPSVVMALAYIENSHYKWVSSDKAILVVDSGRVIRTVGLSPNLIYVSNTESDPLKLFSGPLESRSNQYTWSRVIDSSNDEYGHAIESTFAPFTTDKLQVKNQEIEARLFIETVHYNAPATFVQLDKGWKNYYWYAENGDLIKSVQKVSPLTESLDITYLSRIARLNL